MCTYLCRKIVQQQRGQQVQPPTRTSRGAIAQKRNGFSGRSRRMLSNLGAQTGQKGAKERKRRKNVAAYISASRKTGSPAPPSKARKVWCTYSCIYIFTLTFSGGSLRLSPLDFFPIARARLANPVRVLYTPSERKEHCKSGRKVKWLS